MIHIQCIFFSVGLTAGNLRMYASTQATSAAGTTRSRHAGNVPTPASAGTGAGVGAGTCRDLEGGTRRQGAGTGAGAGAGTRRDLEGGNTPARCRRRHT